MLASLAVENKAKLSELEKRQGVYSWEGRLVLESGLVQLFPSKRVGVLLLVCRWVGHSLDLGDRLEMHFLTASYRYMARWLLGYMEDAEVISPDALKEIMMENSDRLHAHYHGASKK